jgi:capping protein alpha
MTRQNQRNNDGFRSFWQHDSATMSNESRLDIARRIILTAPPGQFDALVQDFHTIFAASGESLLTDEYVEQVRAEYDKSRTNLAGGAAADTPGTTELYKRVKEYQSSKAVESAFSVEGDDATTTVVRTYAERIDTSNRIAGSWTAEWTIQSSGTVTGKVIVQAHAYEEGSIQLNTTRTFGPEQQQGDVVKLIEKWEQEVMDSLAETYDTMQDKLKSLRRIMPVTRTRMDWNVLSHRMRKMLGDSSKE